MPTLVFDTEFTSFRADSKIISIGIVDPETGRHFYAEILDTIREMVGGKEPTAQNLIAINDDFVGQFTIDNVLPQLDIDQHGMSRADAAKGLIDFVTSYGEPVRLACDGRQWDFAMLEQLLEDSEWPKCIKRIMSEVVDLSEEHDALLFGGHEFPHHALKDAQILADACREMLRSA